MNDPNRFRDHVKMQNTVYDDPWRQMKFEELLDALKLLVERADRRRSFLKIAQQNLEDTNR